MAKMYTIHEAKTHLSRLIARASAGEEVLIARGKTPVARLTPDGMDVPARRFGAMKGKARVSASFFEPLPEEELTTWNE
jgi:prevent-host-death family protein